MQDLMDSYIRIPATARCHPAAATQTTASPDQNSPVNSTAGETRILNLTQKLKGKSDTAI
jgi:hypothetical protein